MARSVRGKKASPVNRPKVSDASAHALQAISSVQDEFARHLKEALASTDEPHALAKTIDLLDELVREAQAELVESSRLPVEATMTLAQRKLERATDISRRVVAHSLKISRQNDDALEEKRQELLSAVIPGQRVRLNSAITPLRWASHDELELNEEQIEGLRAVGRRRAKRDAGKSRKAPSKSLETTRRRATARRSRAR